MVMRFALLLSFLLLAPSAGAQTAVGIDSLDRYIRSELTRQRIPGLSVAVLRGDSVVLVRGYGSANVEHRVPTSDSTAYEVGSVSKQFTAAAIVLLAEEGRLRLDDIITRYLPEGSTVWSGVTIGHLLTHTSGIADQSLDTLDWRKDYTEDELVHLAVAQPLMFSPGASYGYSGTGYILLGVIIHRVTGEFYGVFLRERVFRPLSMQSARVNSDSAIIPNRAAGYRFEHTVLKNREWTSPTLRAQADGGLSLSIRDLIQWSIALNHGEPLGEAGLAASWTPVRLNPGWTFPYGFGWHLQQQRGFRRIGHSGARDGFRATIQRYPDFGLTVIVLTNLDEANPDGIAFGIAGLLEPALLPPHLLAGRLNGKAPSKPVENLLRDVAAAQDTTDLTRGLRAVTPPARRELITSLLKALQDGTFLGCEGVTRGLMTRLDTRIESICYGRGPVRQGEREGNVVFAVLYGADWRAAGIDLYFF